MFDGDCSVPWPVGLAMVAGKDGMRIDGGVAIDQLGRLCLRWNLEIAGITTGGTRGTRSQWDLKIAGSSWSDGRGGQGAWSLALTALPSSSSPSGFA